MHPRLTPVLSILLCTASLLPVAGQIQLESKRLSIEDKLSLMDNVTIASKRAKKLSPYKNPSTTIYELIEELDKLKGKN